MSAHRYRAEADAAKASMLGEIRQLKTRLSPSTLASDVVETARDKAVEVTGRVTDFATRKPVLVGSVAGAAILLLVRKPLLRLFRRPPKHHDRFAGQSEGNLS